MQTTNHNSKLISIVGLLVVCTHGVFSQVTVEPVLPVRAELSNSDVDEKISAEVLAKQAREANKLVNRIEFDVVERKTVSLGDRNLILNRVAPPTLPASTVSADQRQPTREPTAEEIAAWEAYQAKEQHAVMISATVFDHRITQIQWRHEGNQYQAWSSIDWNYLRGVGDIETRTANYWFLMGIGDMSEEDIDARSQAMREAGMENYEPKKIPTFEGFTPGKAEYFVEVQDERQTLNEDAYAPIDALHAYYERNAAQLQINYRNTMKLNDARKAYREANPEEPKDTAVNFWPIKSKVHKSQEGTK